MQLARNMEARPQTAAMRSFPLRIEISIIFMAGWHLIRPALTLLTETRIPAFHRLIHILSPDYIGTGANFSKQSQIIPIYHKYLLLLFIDRHLLWHHIRGLQQGSLYFEERLNSGFELITLFLRLAYVAPEAIKWLRIFLIIYEISRILGRIKLDRNNFRCISNIIH